MPLVREDEGVSEGEKVTDNIAQFPSMGQLGDPHFRKMMRRAIKENRQVQPLTFGTAPRHGKMISFRRMADLPRIGKEDPVDGNQTP